MAGARLKFGMLYVDRMRKVSEQVQVQFANVTISHLQTVHTLNRSYCEKIYKTKHMYSVHVESTSHSTGNFRRLFVQM